ncbi:phosphoribosyltransferase [Acidihalobacter prosperus]|uniref:Phosphoribosyltransferase domain-containing protein n=1 Tax=Acidihalobacter prosperus TaxID=160660 RepID=A0A1A6C6B6_9GAMM|nr:phosphoribosyltransferase family protein [Acidihalobacter prosperus]OBS10075.1 hypothetical protein Thpro_021125 [Acidihalobacter prosperus]
MPTYFENRRDAGRQLAAMLGDSLTAEDKSPLVLALPRGGVPVAYEIACALDAPLDVMVVRKLGVPQYPELAMGAIASGGVRTMNEAVVQDLGIDPQAVETVDRHARQALEARERLYRGTRGAMPLRDRTIIVVDDGLATGASLRAALQAVRAGRPARVVVALPVAPAGARADFATLADRFVCLHEPEDFLSVGEYYVDFAQTDDHTVRTLLSRRTARASEPPAH